jgi:hypothetical protein
MKSVDCSFKTTLATAICVATSMSSAGDNVTRHISLLSVSFDLPKRLLVETEGTNGVDEIVAMPPGKCATQYCLPVVMAWECRLDADPKCSELNMLPPDDLCAGTLPQPVSRSSGLNEMRWVCPKAGFTVFDLKSGKLVVSYLGAENDVSAGVFFDGVARSIKAK